MDPPKHDEQRKVVGPIVAPRRNLAEMEATIRERTIRVLEGLSAQRGLRLGRARVDRADDNDASRPLFNYPWEDRPPADVLVRRSRSAMSIAPESPVHSEQEKFDELKKMAERMAELYNERASQPPKFDLLSMLAHGPATQNMPLREFMGNLTLLIVGGKRQRRAIR